MKLTTTKCALCEQYKILQDSHFVPKAIYRRLSKGVAKDLPSAIKVDPVAGTSILSGQQLKQPLLCQDCEHLFSLHGESKVIPQLRNRAIFPLRDVSLSGVDLLRACDSEPTGLDREAYIYFALSVAWRGSVAKWPNPHDSMYKQLGPYEIKIGQWLQEKGKLPTNVSLDVLVDTDENSPALGTPDISYDSDLSDSRVFQFVALGVWFRLHVGGKLTCKGKNYLQNGSHPIVYRKISFGGVGMNDHVLKQLQKTEFKGKLATLRPQK